jgi:thymidylate synthase (FAD)
MTELPEGYVRVLDKGYVGLLGVHGSDHGKVSPPNAARASFKKSSDQFTDEQNDKLTHYLLRNNELACFRHNTMTFEVRMPLFVARQFWKYVVSSNWTSDQLGWNENSKRYITDENEFYIPGIEKWRSAPKNKKQGSGDNLNLEVGAVWTTELEEWCARGEELYQEALEAGIAPEQARLFTSNGNYVTCQWTTSLNALLHFLDERLDDHAQYEIRQYAFAIRDFLQEAFPVVFDAWIDIDVQRSINKVHLEDYPKLMEENVALRAELSRLRDEISNTRKSWISRIWGA